MSERKTYDLSLIAFDMGGKKPLVEDDEKELTLRDVIVKAFRVRGQNDNLDQETVNFYRKIVKKLEKAEDISAIALNSKAIEACKTRVRTIFFPGVSYQVTEAFDGEPTAAQLDEI
jgi:hypothetical protein